MSDFSIMLHMDVDYMWCWYIIDTLGNPVLMSARAHFLLEDAKQEVDELCAMLKLCA